MPQLNILIAIGGDDPEQDGIYPDTLPGGFDGPESCGIITVCVQWEYLGYPMLTYIYSPRMLSQYPTDKMK